MHYESTTMSITLHILYLLNISTVRVVYELLVGWGEKVRTCVLNCTAHFTCLMLEVNKSLLACQILTPPDHLVFHMSVHTPV